MENATPQTFVNEYFDSFARLVTEAKTLAPDLNTAKHVLQTAGENGQTIYLVGNGGSAAMASHLAVDLTKSAKLRAMTFNDSSLFTCLANDRGHENWMAEAIRHYGRPNDVLIAISSSGNSANVRNACVAAKELNFAHVITFSGFKADNPLRQLGDLNFYVSDSGYNHVENMHQFLLTSIVDLIIGKREYSS
ncbi:MAG: SIS domain-containing protein [bacterium]|nr:SIS domain-containing protein [bacterium]